MKKLLKNKFIKKLLKNKLLKKILIVTLSVVVLVLLILFIISKLESKPNAPILVEGMVAVYFDESNKEIETTFDDPKWYNYSKQKWANAKTEDGSYWVWVPRFAYKISKGYHTDEVGVIDIVFLKGKTNNNKNLINVQTSGYKIGVKDTSMHYFLHPAFVFGEEQSEGFWVAKYAMGLADQESKCNQRLTAPQDTFSDDEKRDTCDNSDLTPISIPNITMWRTISSTEAYDVSKKMNEEENPYGFNSKNADTYLIKNMEWGAIAYLSYSKYGANDMVLRNSNAFYITGCSATNQGSYYEHKCYEYDTPQGMKASTTHNIYGIYDLVGTGTKTSAYVNSGQEDTVKVIKSIIEAPAKYKDEYIAHPSGERADYIELNKQVYGDAVYETSANGNDFLTSWEGAYSLYPYLFHSYISRGGVMFNENGVGLFAYVNGQGGGADFTSFRTVVRPLQ